MLVTRCVMAVVTNPRSHRCLVALFVTGNTSFEYEVCIYLYKVYASTGLSVTWSLER